MPFSGVPRAELAVFFDQAAFVAGDVVRGRVQITVLEPMIAETLCVKFLGMEKVKWTERPATRGELPAPEQIQHPRFRQVFVNRQLNLFNSPEVFRAGEFSYPFTIELPSALPGVFTMKVHSSDAIAKLGAIIRFTVEAVMTVADQGGLGTLCCKDILIIHEKFLGKPRLRQESMTQPVKFSFFTKGTCQVSASIARDVYYPGQTVNVKWEMVATPDSANINVKELHTRLIQVLNVSLGFQDRRTFSRYLTKTKSKGPPSSKNIVHYQPLPLVSASEGFVNPTTTTGANLQCRYLLEMECRLDGASETILLRIPIKIIGLGVECPGLVSTQPLTDDGLAVALRSSSVMSR